MSVYGAALTGTRRRLQHGVLKTDKPPRSIDLTKRIAAGHVRDWLERKRLTEAMSVEERAIVEMLIADLDVG